MKIIEMVSQLTLTVRSVHNHCIKKGQATSLSNRGLIQWIQCLHRIFSVPWSILKLLKTIDLNTMEKFNKNWYFQLVVNFIFNIPTDEIKNYLRRVMEYRAIVVRYSVRYCTKLCKLSWVIANIIIEYSDVLVSIPSLLLMPHSQYVSNLVYRYTKL